MSQSRHALVLRTHGHNGALLLTHDGRRFRKLPKEVPSIWVTAPTQEHLDVGLAINANFSIDPGRARLGSLSDENETLASELGRAFGHPLVGLYQRSESVDWKTFCFDMGLAPDADKYDFWDSLWELLGGLADLSEDSDASRLIRRIFWDPETGAATALYSQCAALPNGLTGDLRGLTLHTEIRYEISGPLSHEKVMPKVVEWAAWKQKRITPSQCVARDHVTGILEKLRILETRLPTQFVTIASVLRWESELDPCLTRERAAQIATVLFADPLFDNRNQPTSEWKSIRPELDKFRFSDTDQIPRPAKQLLVSDLPHSGSDIETCNDLLDEIILARFAPFERVLNRMYLAGPESGMCLRLFKECRASHSPQTREIADWALNAQGTEQKNGVIDYLGSGRRRDALTAELRDRKTDLRHCWLAGLYNSPFLHSDLERRSAIAEYVDQDARYRQRISRSDLNLKKVLDWWRCEGHNDLDPRHHRILDASTSERLLARYDRKDIEQRVSWMRLFMHGMGYTMGRISPAQDNGFVLGFCERKGWVHEFVDPDGRPDRWVKILNEYLNPQCDSSDYLHWMRQFVGIYALAERLDDYVELFLSIDRFGRSFPMTHITCPRSSQEAPVTPPPVARVLGMGACFVVRELLRLGVIKNQFAWEHAFVPTQQVRFLLRELGCELSDVSGRSWEWSREIWKFLVGQFGSEKDATFDLAFDLPFQVLAPNKSK